MSLSNPTLTNPAERYFEWKGGEGKLEFYNKEKQERMTVPLPFEFIVLDQLNGVTGWSDQDNSGIWSNETRSTRDEFTVRTRKGVKYVGPYKNEQGISQVPTGAKYVKIVYIAHKNREGNYIMGRIGLTGAALNAWIDFSKAHSLTSGKVRLTGSTEGKKGATVFQVPTFVWAKFEGDDFNSAVALDKDLQAYLSQYLTAAQIDKENRVTDDHIDDEVGKATPDQIADFEQRKAAARQPVEEVFNDDTPPAKPDTIIEDIGDEPINLDEIPF